jgi:hypothetical protein
MRVERKYMGHRKIFPMGGEKKFPNWNWVGKNGLLPAAVYVSKNFLS